MSDDKVKITVDGRELEARKGAMLIEVTDAAGIHIPRFCYHSKLSVAANCRMCLVEVIKAPKPLPACATPVMDGMEVYTTSPKAIAAQKSTMEFLLINHPLDCPICDQGGECELQDVAMGYGRDVSQFVERKRVVRDKDIGPLVATEMTRCIHCTRCVRFGEEIANLRELGGTGRGEHLEIGTYVEKSLVSEISGNVIDLCPVGALTAKPSRFTGRSWEYVQHPAVSPHDGVGANLYLHVLRNVLKRVVPRDNEAVNEVWIADRDRFSYEGVYADDRLLTAKVRLDGELKAVGWAEALAAVKTQLQGVIDRHGADAVGVLASPTATLEELYLLQKWARALGIGNIDHRLRQSDFSDDAHDPVYPSSGLPFIEYDTVDAALLIGSDLRMEAPLLAHRLRKAHRAGALLMAVNPRHYDYRVALAGECVGDPARFVSELAAVAVALARSRKIAKLEGVDALLKGVDVDSRHTAIAEALSKAERGLVIVGQVAFSHPAFAALRALAVYIARHTGSQLGYVPAGGNTTGAWLAGAVPHRGPGGQAVASPGLDAGRMLAQPRKAYVLFGAEPIADGSDAQTARTALAAAEAVISISPFMDADMAPWITAALPMGTFAETSGTFANLEGRAQGFAGALKPVGEARPGWKVLRVLGNQFDLDGFDFMDSTAVLDEALSHCAAVVADNLVDCGAPVAYRPDGLLRLGEVPIYRSDALVRRSQPLQGTPLNPPVAVRINARMAEELKLTDGGEAAVSQAGDTARLPVVVDATVPDGCVAIAAGTALGALIGPVEVIAA